MEKIFFERKEMGRELNDKNETMDAEFDSMGKEWQEDMEWKFNMVNRGQRKPDGRGAENETLEAGQGRRRGRLEDWLMHNVRKLLVGMLMGKNMTNLEKWSWKPMYMSMDEEKDWMNKTRMDRWRNGTKHNMTEWDDMGWKNKTHWSNGTNLFNVSYDDDHYWDMNFMGM